MEKVDIIIQIEAERLKALDFFLFDKQKSSLKAELEKAAESMYEKFVPDDTRRFIESQMKPAPVPKNRPKRVTRTASAKVEPVFPEETEGDIDEQS